MSNIYLQGNQSPRYMEIAPNGQVIRQEANIPPDAIANYMLPQTSTTYATSSYNNYNNQWQDYPSQSTQKWWMSNGPFNPYRTTYQDYGHQASQRYSSSTGYYIQNTGTTPYPLNNSMGYSTPRP